MKKWVFIVLGSLVAFYFLIVVFRSCLYGRSHEGRVIQPGEFSISVE